MVRAFPIPRLHWWLIGGLLWALTAESAFAATKGARVLRVGKSQNNLAVSHAPNANWLMRDRVCVIQVRTPIACGTVLKVTPKGVIVKLDSPSSDVIAGDLVVAESQTGGGALARATQGNRRPSQIAPRAQLLDSVKNHPESDEYRFNIAAGTAISFSFFYPTVNFQYSITPDFAIGLVPMGLFAGTSGASLTGFGGYATLNYYSQKFYRGLWIQAGAGAVMFSVTGNTVSESATALAAITTIGWRGYWDLGLNIGVGAGAQYMKDPQFTTINIESAGFMPMVVLDVGYNF